MLRRVAKLASCVDVATHWHQHLPATSVRRCPHHFGLWSSNVGPSVVQRSLHASGRGPVSAAAQPRMSASSRLAVLAGCVGAAAFAASSLQSAPHTRRPHASDDHQPAERTDPLLDALSQQISANVSASAASGDAPVAAKGADVPPAQCGMQQPALTGPWITDDTLQAAMQRRCVRV
jgi:hypothetical protein